MQTCGRVARNGRVARHRHLVYLLQVTTVVCSTALFTACKKEVMSQTEMFEAETGNSPWAQTLMWYHYNSGKGRNDPAMGWLLLAAEQGELDAQCALGWVYLPDNGIQLPSDSVDSSRQKQLAYKWLFICQEGLRRVKPSSASEPHEGAAAPPSSDRAGSPSFSETERALKEWIESEREMDQKTKALNRELVSTFLPDLERNMTAEEIRYAKSLAIGWRPLVRAPATGEIGQR